MRPDVLCDFPQRYNLSFLFAPRKVVVSEMLSLWVSVIKVQSSRVALNIVFLQHDGVGTATALQAQATSKHLHSSSHSKNVLRIFLHGQGRQMYRVKVQQCRRLQIFPFLSLDSVCMTTRSSIVLMASLTRCLDTG